MQYLLSFNNTVFVRFTIMSIIQDAVMFLSVMPCSLSFNSIVLVRLTEMSIIQ